MQQQKLITGLNFLLVIGLVATGLMLIAPDQTEAQGQCHKINTTLTSVANFSDFTTVGEIKSGPLKGTTKFTGDPASLTPIIGPSLPPVEPRTFSYTGNLEITTDQGTLTTRGVGVFEGVPFGIGTQFDRVIGGTDRFAGATGVLYSTFAADATGGAFTSAVSGEICVH
jgi:hypothetical protein